MNHRHVPLVLIAFASSVLADDVKLSRTDLAKKGKPSAVLVLVEVPGALISGTGAVVHPGGLVVTCNHVVKPGRTVNDIKVVLNAGLSDQKVLKGKVIRSDAETDLALLRVEQAGQLPALELGDSDSLSELTELIGFGFPFGAQLASDKEVAPAVTVTVNSVTSLRRKENALASIQLDGALNQGHSGGPVLSADGKLMGVISRGIVGAQTASAIPANVLKAFLAAPDLSLMLPNADTTKLHQPAVFIAEATFPLPPPAQPKLELVLDLGDGSPRTVPMTATNESFRAEAVLVPPPAVEYVTAAMKFDNVTLTGPLADREFHIDGRKVMVSQLKRISAGKYTHSDGTNRGGAVTGLDSVPFTISGREILLDLTKADEVLITPPARPTQLTCTVIARVGGVEKGRVQQVLSLATPLRTAPNPLQGGTLEARKVTRKLPEAFTDVCMGGGGRYLLFFLPKLSKIACFDVTQTKVVHYFPAADAETKFAAGADKLVIVLPGNRLIQRWDLTTRERELSVTLGEQLSIRTVAMGHASSGPVAVNAALYDLSTLKPLEVSSSGNRGGGRMLGDPNNRVRVSADGTVFSVWHTAGNPSGLTAFVYHNNELTGYYDHKDVGHIAPGPDGRYLYTSAGVYTRELKAVSADEKSQAWAVYLPAAHGNLYFAARPSDLGHNQNATPSLQIEVYVAGDNRLLTTFDTIRGNYEVNRWARESVGTHNRLWLIPDAKLFVSLPATNDTIELTRFELDEALAATGVDYLFVASEPPTLAKKGAPYSHQLVVKSKKGGVKVKLDTGPAGMTVSPTGRIEWPSPEGKTATAVVSVSDASGQQVFKSFTIEVD